MLAIGVAWLYTHFVAPQNKHKEVATPVAQSSDLHRIFETQQSGVMVNTVGDVVRILPDDNKGSRHQRFIISTPEGLSILIAHNIDLAPRVPLKVGDQVGVYGQYEWNHKGGIIHWTHHDPKKIHPGGWIVHQTAKYE